MGEGLVKSITKNPAENESQIRDESPEPKPNLTKAMRQRPPAYSMHIQDKISLKDYYEQGPLTPKKQDESSSLIIENVDTQVINIEADFELEQLDIGEEPVFERNAIKRTSMNIF